MLNRSSMILPRGGANLGAGRIMHPPHFSNFSIFTVLTHPASNALTPPPLQILGTALDSTPFEILLKVSITIFITKYAYSLIQIIQIYDKYIKKYYCTNYRIMSINESRQTQRLTVAITTSDCSDVYHCAPSD